MNNATVKLIAAHDKERAKHFEEFRKSFLAKPEKFKERLGRSLQYLHDLAEFGDGKKLGQAILGARLGIFGFHLVFEAIARWEEENAESEKAEGHGGEE